MAKYDQGGGCACGLMKVCDCDSNSQADGTQARPDNFCDTQGHDWVYDRKGGGHRGEYNHFCNNCGKEDWFASYAMPERKKITAEWGSRLARTSYLVLPRLAIEAMSQDWQDLLEVLLVEAEEKGMETPDYYVFRNLDYCEGFAFGVSNVGAHGHPHYVFGGRKGIGDDPWADYKYGNIADVCSTFKQRSEDADIPE